MLSVQRFLPEETMVPHLACSPQDMKGQQHNPIRKFFAAGAEECSPAALVDAGVAGVALLGQGCAVKARRGAQALVASAFVGAEAEGADDGEGEVLGAVVHGGVLGVGVSTVWAAVVHGGHPGQVSPSTSKGHRACPVASSSRPLQ